MNEQEIIDSLEDGWINELGDDGWQEVTRTSLEAQGLLPKRKPVIYVIQSIDYDDLFQGEDGKWGAIGNARKFSYNPRGPEINIGGRIREFPIGNISGDPQIEGRFFYTTKKGRAIARAEARLEEAQADTERAQEELKKAREAK